MKIMDILCVILDILMIGEAFLEVRYGNPTAWDYGMLYCGASLLVAIVVGLICREIQIQKKLKQMREEEKKNQGC